MSDDPLSVLEISELTGREKSWVHKKVNDLNSMGTIFKATESRGRIAATYSLNT